MKKLSSHDEREIKSYVKSNPQSLKFGKARHEALEKKKGKKESKEENRRSGLKGYKDND